MGCVGLNLSAPEIWAHRVLNEAEVEASVCEQYQSSIYLSIIYQSIIYLPIHPSIYSSINYLSTYVSSMYWLIHHLYRFIHWSIIYLSIYWSISQSSIYPSIIYYLFIYQSSINLSLGISLICPLSIYPHLSINLSIDLSPIILSTDISLCLISLSGGRRWNSRELETEDPNWHLISCDLEKIPLVFRHWIFPLCEYYNIFFLEFLWGLNDPDSKRVKCQHFLECMRGFRKQW